MYYNDNGEIKPINVKASDTLPIGTIVGYSSLNAPSGWLICDGSEVSRTTYSKLFEVIGTTYGSGDGSTTFNLPNYKGKVAVGYNSSETEFDTLGETGGEKTHTLTGSEIPQHSHQMPIQAGNDTIDRQYNASWLDNQKGNQGDANSTGVRTSVYGGSQAHNNLQPYSVTNYIIKAHNNAAVVAKVEQDLSSNSEINVPSVRAVNTKINGIVVNTLAGNETNLAPSIKAVNNANSYSKSETFTGKYWINGKPIYRKVIDWTIPSQTTSYTNIVLLTGHQLIKWEAYCMQNDIVTNLLFERSVTGIYLTRDNGVWRLHYKPNGGDIVGYSYCIIEYTKTTD